MEGGGSHVSMNGDMSEEGSDGCRPSCTVLHEASVLQAIYKQVAV